eukprot:PhF_6_TR5128/c0_g1_i2/m.7279/K19219/JMJD7; jumonji domain-containing protein 7
MTHLPGERELHDALALRTIPVIDVSTTPIDVTTFMREHVSQSIPVVLRGMASRWPAVSLWSPAYLSEAMPGPTTITVALTPTGRADAIDDQQGGAFLAPSEVQMTMPEFMKMLLAPQGHVVPYAQRQNDCLASEYGPLLGDIRPDVEEFGTEAFGGAPDASNMWIGAGSSVTSMHQDWYENLYVVVSGKKRFRLVPPWECMYAPKEDVPEGKYVYNPTTHSFTIEINPGATVPWIHRTVDAMKDMGAHVVDVEVGPGDVLYLPAMWFHEVHQDETPGAITIAVNYWYDMKFGPMYYYQQMLKKLHKNNSS